jgi:hypothetical protein
MDTFRTGSDGRDQGEGQEKLRGYTHITATEKLGELCGTSEMAGKLQSHETMSS